MASIASRVISRLLDHSASLRCAWSVHTTFMAATEQELCRSGKKVKTGKSSLAFGKNREVSGNEIAIPAINSSGRKARQQNRPEAEKVRALLNSGIQVCAPHYFEMSAGDIHNCSGSMPARFLIACIVCKIS